MKILWLVNVSLPEASLLMGEKPSPFGGWLINASKTLVELEQVELSIAFPHNGTNNFKKLNGHDITYYPFHEIRDKDKKIIKNSTILRNIIEDAKPDLVHIYGTELAHSLSMVNVCKKENIETIVSIQGLVSIYEKHMFVNLPFKVVYGLTIRNILRNDSVAGLKKIFIKRGENEIEALRKTNHIIGRTTWDKACTSQISPLAKYYICNETLRDEFYRHQWNIENCEKHSMFLSQGQYSIKGLHNILEAMPIIMSKYPNAKLYVGGKNITKSATLKDKLLITYYGKYIKELIRKINIDNNVIFTGPLDEKQMCERYLKSNVFVCPSSIENSPNSLGEAMILGVPSVVSYAGGVPDMLRYQEDGFVYQADAPYMLAHYVCEIFENEDLALNFSEKARSHALKTHNREENTKRLIEIYDSIIGGY